MSSQNKKVKLLKVPSVVFSLITTFTLLMKYNTEVNTAGVKYSSHAVMRSCCKEEEKKQNNLQNKDLLK